MLLSFLLQTASANNFIFHWESSFDIEICKNAGVTSKELKDVIDYWDDSIQFNVKTISENSDCESIKNNVIQIKSGDNLLPDNVYGTTDIEWFYYNYAPDKKYINNATIKLSNKFIKKDNTTLKHEMGHALGLDHYDHEIMRSHF